LNLYINFVALWSRSFALLVCSLVLPSLGSADERISVPKVLEHGLVSADLNLAPKAFQTRLEKLSADSKAFEIDPIEPEDRVSGAKGWWIVSISRRKPHLTNLLIKPGQGKSITAIELPSAKAKRTVLAGNWRKWNDLLIGAGETIGTTTMFPDGGIQVFSIKGQSARLLQEVQSDWPAGGLGFRFSTGPQLRVVGDTRRDKFVSPFHNRWKGPYLTFRTEWLLRSGTFRKVGTHLLKNGIWAFDQVVSATLRHQDRKLREFVPDLKIRTALQRAIRASFSSGHNTVSISGDQDELTGNAFRLGSYEDPNKHSSWFYLANQAQHWVLTSVGAD